MTTATPQHVGLRAPWQQRLAHVIDTMREMSGHTDPQAMVQAYGKKVRQLIPVDGSISLSRRGLSSPQYRITRSSRWVDQVNPWKEKSRLPLLSGGLLSELIYGDEPVIIDDLDVSPDDPAADYLQGNRSLVAIPMFDQRVSLNMVVLMRKDPGAFDPELLPEQVWMSNLFGRATHSLVLRQELQQAYDEVDKEMQTVADIQRSLLPVELPEIPTLRLATHYRTSRRAGGDYYDFFPLPDGRWGIFIADVSGHGTPAAVVMAITHSIAHMCIDHAPPPAKLLSAVNHRLARKYTNGSGTFVTAFYGVYDPASHQLTYSSAGHWPPRVKRGAELLELRGARSLPLGIIEDEPYRDATETLAPGDTLFLFTDGITDVRNKSQEILGISGLDAVLAQSPEDPRAAADAILAALDQFSEGTPVPDDQTLIVARVS